MGTQRNILLIEPNYKNKYPPIGLMKLATYHRMLGDNVIFYKGDLKKFVLDDICCQFIKKLLFVDNSIDWNSHWDKLCQYVMTGKHEIKNELISNSMYVKALDNWFEHFKNQYRKGEYYENPKWDRICITTLFTFYWKKTVETIQFAKKLVKDESELLVGGILATVLASELEEETGIIPHRGLLNQKGVLDKNEIIIDELPLDYSILDEIEYNYPENNAFYGYMTRGCIRTCSFCAVPKLEPKFIDFIPLKEQIKEVSEKYGEQRNLLLLDNNVLASNCFSKIIQEIKEAGFARGAKFIEPNYLDLTINNLKEGYNDRAFIIKSHELLHNLLNKLRNQAQQDFYDLLDSYQLLSLKTTTKANLISIYPEVKELFEKHRNKNAKLRFVDFNQGVDARLLVADENKMKLLSEIAIRPLRIAFDSMRNESEYVKSVKLAAKYKIRHLSNYLLYNEKDKPEELYQRLKINIELCENYDLIIHSFPMKFHPINGKEWFANRNYIGKYWNRKFLRAVQTILNATKGKIGRGSSFFYEAFGHNEEEFFKLLYMPETYILFRFFFKDSGYTEKWWKEFNAFEANDLISVKSIIESNEFKDVESLKCSKEVKDFILRHYQITREDINNPNSDIFKEKAKYDNAKKKLKVTTDN